ncbi:bifunctional hydroxymethylpyrimidine kinase/phosphomethylpyrimidine kinase [Pseudoruegeria sp. HB172150]|uniref:bifunctional hydroxymethylpyrimidine kinase/phosphomethylpyrimidine kinase n=1 Tax=Pseudoruegeria sp. HB172150 TaxID=2721164 RepID=UPI001555BB72|nr:bifunctional hydroxymethylpyrimidine kinase/phosphomethylpyrimidine kinase [Pseudoruegeria sp. HB172150]
MISSWVAYGHVGLSAAAPALQALGHTVTQLPTTTLSNHPAWPHVAGSPVPVDRLAAMRDALDANGWLADHEAVLTGYLPTPDHAAFAAETIDRLRASDHPPAVTVDPTLGDLPKGLYIAADAAAALRDLVVPRADILTPNLFELGWLTGEDDPDRAAARLLQDTEVKAIRVTSPPAKPGRTGILEVTRTATRRFLADHHQGVPHGVGDVFSALTAAGLSCGAALGHLQSLIDHSLQADHLRIAETAAIWTRAAPIAPDLERT